MDQTLYNLSIFLNVCLIFIVIYLILQKPKIIKETEIKKEKEVRKTVAKEALSVAHENTTYAKKISVIKSVIGKGLEADFKSRYMCKDKVAFKTKLKEQLPTMVSKLNSACVSSSLQFALTGKPHDIESIESQLDTLLIAVYKDKLCEASKVEIDKVEKLLMNIIDDACGDGVYWKKMFSDTINLNFSNLIQYLNTMIKA